MKKTLIFVVLTVMMIAVFTSCNLPNIEEFETFSENNELLNTAITNLQTQANTLMTSQSTPDNVKQSFELDLLSVQALQASELIYYGIISLYNTKLIDLTGYSDMQNLKIEKNNDTYTMTFSNQSSNHSVTVKTNETSSSVVMMTDGAFEFSIEKIKLNDDEFATQFCWKEGTDYIIYQFYVKGNTGRLAINDKGTARPDAIYNAPSKITSSFATTGTRTYNITSSQFTYTGIESVSEGFTVTFNANGGSAVASGTYKLINTAPSTTRAGYVFDGWYANAECTGNAIVFPYTVPADVTLYAKWTQATQYTATFNAKGGTAVSSITDSVINTCPATTRSGYTFSGWFTNEGCTGTSITFPYTLTADITLYAKWTEGENVLFTVTFATNGGSTVNSITAKTIDTSPATERNDYYFLGWYLDSDCTGDAVAFPYAITANATFYAKWEPLTDPILYPAIVDSIDEYYLTLSHYENGFVWGNVQNIPYDKNNPEPNNFHSEIMINNLTSDWSAPFILNDCAKAIKDHKDGTFAENNPGRELNKITYTPSLEFVEATNSYTIKLWLSKSGGIGTNYYWFEINMQFDEETHILNATIYCGINEGRILRNTISYTKSTNGIFTSWIKYPEDFDNPEAEKNILWFKGKSKDGEVKEIRFIPEDYVVGTYENIGDNYDRMMSFYNNAMTYTDKRICAEDDFLQKFIPFHEALFNQIKLNAGETFFYEDEYSYTNNFSLNFYEFMNYIINVDMKMLNYTDEGETKEYSVTDGFRTLTVASEDSSIVYGYQVKFNGLDKIIFKYAETDNTYWINQELVIIKLTQGYAVQFYEFSEDEYQTSHKVTEVRLNDSHNARMYVKDNIPNKPVSIYDSYDEGTFATNGDYGYTFVDDELYPHNIED